MKNLFENIVNNLLLEFSDGATNAGTSLDFVNGRDTKDGIYVYHACHADSKDNIIQAGARRIFVASNICASYGDGLYTTYTLKSAKLNSTRRGNNHKDGFLYGSTIVRGICKTNLKNMAIFDPNISKQVYGYEKTIEDQLKDMIPDKHLLNGIVSSIYWSDVVNSFKPNCHTATGAYSLWKIIERQENTYHLRPRKYIKGLIFSGGNDGNVLVAFDFASVEIVAYTTDRGNSFVPIDRNEWIHKELANNVDLQHELGNLYDVYPTQGFVNGFAIVGKNINYNTKYRILNQKEFYKERKNGDLDKDGRISDLYFDEVYGQSFDVSNTIKVKYSGEDYIIRFKPLKSRNLYKVYDADEGVYLCDLENLDKYLLTQKNKQYISNQQVQDTTDWGNMDLSGF